MSCKFKYKGKFYTKKELEIEFLRDPKIAEKYLPKEERSLREDYTREDLSVFERKIDRLKKTMDVEVIMDKTIDSSRVLASGDKRTKEAGKPVILINPDSIFTTTAIHEFGHIFIDSFPKGIDNPRLKKAYEMLKGTDLEKEVKELYPELNDEMFAKELITTAIGRKGSEIWDSVDNQGIWESIKQWFLSFLKKKFGFSTMDEVESLTRELLNKKKKATGSSTINQYLKAERINVKEEEGSTKADKSIQALEKVYKDVHARIANIHREYKPEGAQAEERELALSAKGTTQFESITELKDAVEDLDKVDRMLGIEKYIQWVDKEVDKVKKVFSKRKESKTLTDKKIQASVQWNEGFSLVEEIQGLIVGLRQADELSEEKFDEYRKLISEIQAKRTELESDLLEETRKAYAKFVADTDNKIRTQYENSFEKEYEDLGLSSSGQSLDSYVKERLRDEEGKIREEAYDQAYQESYHAISDLHGFAAIALSEKNANSNDIQLLSGAAEKADKKVNFFAQDEAAQFDADNEIFKKISNNTNQANKYKNMYEFSEGGQAYYTEKYRPDFAEERSEFIKSIHDKDHGHEKYKDIKVSKAKGKKLEYVIDGETREIEIYGAWNYNVETNENGESIHISYTLDGEKKYTQTTEAIAKSEYARWKNENIDFEEINGVYKGTPKKKWESENYKKLSDEQKKSLDFLKRKAKEGNNLTKGKNSLFTKKAFGQEFIRLPGVLKKDTQRIIQGQYKDSIMHKVNEMTSTQKDDFETQDGGEGILQSFRKVYANVSNKEKLKVPIAFRARLKAEEQSLDLHTITLMNLVSAKNHEVKEELETTFLIVLDVMKNRNVPDTTGVDRLKKVHMLSEDTPIYKDKGASQDYKKGLDILQNRIYGIKNIDSGRISAGTKKDGTKREVDINALTRSWLKFSGWVSLTLNWINSTVNLSTGTISNLIEASAGEHYNLKDWAVGKKKYWTNIKEIANDWGSNVDKSRTNLFMNAFNVMGDGNYLDNDFSEKNKFQALMKMDSLRPLAKMGEHMMQAQVMYATLNHIKVMDKDGNYLDINGDVVKDKKNAASLDEMIEFTPDTSTGGINVKLNPKVESSTFTRVGGPEQVIQEAINLVRYKVRELHGNYDPNIQAAAQRHALGKLTWFLRKWIEEGYFRRWRGTKNIFTKNSEIDELDKFYSQDAKSEREGYYVTATRFLTRVIAPAVMQMNIEIIKEGAGNLSTSQKANLKKLITELGMIALSLAAYLAMDEDEDEILYKYIFRRQLAELSFFINPPDALKVVSTPTASIGTIRNIFKVLSQSLDPLETYEQGPHKGRNKLQVALLKNVPIFSQTLRDTKSSLDFLKNSAGL